jgi:hypothetical protein
MPTKPPNPVKRWRDDDERTHRTYALYVMNRILQHVRDYAYNTRSHMPNGVDYTEFDDAVNKVVGFLNARPDWNDAAYSRATMEDAWDKSTAELAEELEKEFGIEEKGIANGR